MIPFEAFFAEHRDHVWHWCSLCSLTAAEAEARFEAVFIDVLRQYRHLPELLELGIDPRLWLDLLINASQPREAVTAR